MSPIRSMTRSRSCWKRVSYRRSLSPRDELIPLVPRLRLGTPIIAAPAVRPPPEFNQTATHQPPRVSVRLLRQAIPKPDANAWRLIWCSTPFPGSGWECSSSWLLRRDRYAGVEDVPVGFVRHSLVTRICVGGAEFVFRRKTSTID